MESRRLELSDLATVQEAEIIKDPFKYLNLPQNSSPEQVRKSYIQLARKYHPDLVNPQFNIKRLSELYSNEDIKEAKLGYSLDEVIKLWKNPKTKPEKLGNILEGVRLIAHKKMILFNRAYEEIKSRHNPKKWSNLFGYESETVFDSYEGQYTKNVNLEGRGEVIVYPNNFEYWVAGPYLRFDYGPDDDHPWVDWDYRHSLNLRHMFAHIEINEGKKINRVLLEPFFDCFKLDKSKSNTLIDTLSAGKTTEEVMQKVGVPHEHNVSKNTGEYKDKWLYSLKFRRQVNEIIHLETEPEWCNSGIHLKVNNEKLTLEDYSQTNFSEADYLLFLTLAYGPLLK